MCLVLEITDRVVNGGCPLSISFRARHRNGLSYALNRKCNRPYNLESGLPMLSVKKSTLPFLPRENQSYIGHYINYDVTE